MAHTTEHQRAHSERDEHGQVHCVDEADTEKHFTVGILGNVDRVPAKRQEDGLVAVFGEVSISAVNVHLLLAGQLALGDGQIVLALLVGAERETCERLNVERIRQRWLVKEDLLPVLANDGEAI